MLTVIILGYTVAAILLVFAIKDKIEEKQAKRNMFLVTVEYTKYPNKRFFKSQQHKGKSENNQFMQTVVQINNPSTIIDDAIESIKSKHKNANNFFIKDIKKIS